MKRIPQSEFQDRIGKLREYMAREHVDLFLVYGDEYRREIT